MTEKRNKHIFIPTQSPENWQQFLAEPEKQWPTGYSARALAYSWESVDDFPARVKAIFAQANKEALRNPAILLAIPEHKVPLPPYRGGASQNDLFVLAKADNGALISMMVEGKVAEPFGETLEEWVKGMSTGQKERLDFSKSELGISEIPVHIRYQLLHRTVSAILEAKRFNAKLAVVLVHSFHQEHKWFEDYAAFLKLYHVEATPDQLYFLRDCDGVALYSGWVTGDARFLSV